MVDWGLCQNRDWSCPRRAGDGVGVTIQLKKTQERSQALLSCAGEEADFLTVSGGTRGGGADVRERLLCVSLETRIKLFTQMGRFQLHGMKNCLAYMAC